MKPTLVAICRDCWTQGEGFYLDAEMAGTECPMDHDGARHKLTKRRLYICDIPNHCELVMGYPTLAELQEHQAEE